jgi:hypothetical protein
MCGIRGVVEPGRRGVSAASSARRREQDVPAPNIVP